MLQTHNRMQKNILMKIYTDKKANHFNLHYKKTRHKTLARPGVFYIDSDLGRVGHVPESALVRGDRLGDVEAFLDVRHTDVDVVVL